MATVLERGPGVRTRTWSSAWTAAAQSFWRRERPQEHFRTSAGSVVADYVVAELQRLDEAWGRPDRVSVLDVGAGSGDLLAQVHDRAPSVLRERLAVIGVDVRPPDFDIDWRIAWAPADLGIGAVTGVVMAHEWLDEIPCDVVMRHRGRDCLVLVDANGIEEMGPDLEDVAACASAGVDAVAARAWLARWWPLREDGDRAEVGIPRDEAWRWLASLLLQGVVLASDYAHDRGERMTRYRAGTLTGYAGGRIVEPRPDGTVNLTAHVAADACAAALPGSVTMSQRDVLGAEIPLPDPVDSIAYAEALAMRSTQALLRAPGGLGSFTWLRWERR